MQRDEFAETMKKAQLGDERAIEKLYAAYFGKIAATAFAIVRNRDDAYDIASEVFLKLIENGMDAEVRNPTAYLMAMAKNAALNHVKRRSREIGAAEVRGNAEALPDMLWLIDILQLLTEEEREIFELHILWDRTLKETAAQLGLTLGSVRARYKKLKKKVRDYYRKGEK